MSKYVLIGIGMFFYASSIYIMKTDPKTTENTILVLCSWFLCLNCAIGASILFELEKQSKS